MKYLLLNICILLFLFSCGNDRPQKEKKLEALTQIDSSSLKIQYNYTARHRKNEKYDSLLIESKKLKQLSIEKNNFYYLAQSEYLIGIHHFYKDNNDSAYHYFNQARAQYLRINDSIGINRMMRSMALVQTKVGDFEGAKQSSLGSLDYVPQKDSEQIKSDIYVVLGYTALVQKEYETAIDWYGKVSGDSVKHVTKLSALSNKVYTFIELGEKSPQYYHKAQTLLDSLLQDKYSLTKANLFASALDYTALIHLKKHPTRPDSGLFFQALRIRKTNRDKPGLLNSYESLCKYYSHSNNRNVVVYADSMYQVASKLNDHRKRLVALKFKIEYDQLSKVPNHAIQYKELRDSMDEVRNQSIIQFAKIRFEINEKRKENSRLKTELAQKEVKIERNKNILFMVLILVALLTIGIVYYHRMQMIKNQKKLIEEIQKAEQKLSNKVHDELANTLYQTISFVDGNETIQNKEVKESLIEKLDQVYKLSRDISRESQAIKTNKYYPQEIFSLISYYKTETTNIILVGFQEEPWLEISDEIKLHFYKILLELLTNMRKHSHSTLVSLKFEFFPNKLDFTYSDNGVGAKIDESTPINGLKNIESRIDFIKAKGSILPSQRGFKFFISIPIETIHK